MSLALTSRDLRGELMDDPGLNALEHRRALDGLARLNRAAGVASSLWPVVHSFARCVNRPLRVLDIACGSGDVTLAIAAQARRAGLPMHISGCDVSPTAIECSVRRARAAGTDAAFFECDALDGELPDDFDVHICSLFLHHLSNAQAASLVAAMGRRAGAGVVISDLRRCVRGLALAWSASRLLSRSNIVHVDAVRSVRAAFTIPEIRDITGAAGLGNAQISPSWPCRFLIHWKRH